MIKKLIALSILLIPSIVFCEDSVQPSGRPKRPNIPFGNVGWNRHRNNVGFAPVIAWYPNGVMLQAGPVVVSPDRRYVRFGVNMGFGQVTGFDTFNFYNGETRHFK